MSVFPASVSRAPSQLLSRLGVDLSHRTARELAQITEQLSTGLALNRPSDDAVNAAVVGALDDRLGIAAQTQRNLDNAGASLAGLDSALREAGDLLLEARGIAQEQLNVTSTAGERRAMADVIQTIIDGLVRTANTESTSGFVLGGSTPGTRPIESFSGGYRYLGEGDGLRTALGDGLGPGGASGGAGLPITLGGETALGSASARVLGLRELSPALTEGTRLVDVVGARGLAIGGGEPNTGVLDPGPGVITLTIDPDGSGLTPGGDPIAPIDVDLSRADTAGDVAEAIEGAIRRYEVEQGVTVLGPGGVVAGSAGGRGAFAFDLVGGGGGGGSPTLTFGDAGAGATAKDLGLAPEVGTLSFDAVGNVARPLTPMLTGETEVSALDLSQTTGGVDTGGTLGQIRLRAQGRVVTVDLSDATTVREVQNRIEDAGLGLETELSGNRLVVRNAVGGGRDSALSIEDADATQSAGLLGIRTLDPQTPTQALNDGRGVRAIADGVDPVSGLPDAARAVDFTVVLGDGTELTVDLRPSDLGTLGDVVGAINAQLNDQLTALGRPATLVQAELVALPEGAGLAIVQDVADPAFGAGLVDPLVIRSENNSQAAADLGLIEGSAFGAGEVRYDGATGRLVGADVSRVRPDNAFTALVDLRDALLADDTTGIALAGDALEESIDRLADSRGLVGGRARLVENEVRFQEDRSVLDESLRSELRDLDFVDASSRFTLLQTQLQAGYQAISASNQLSLLNFI